MVGGVTESASNIKVGPGLDPTTQMGPLVSDEQFARVTSYIEKGRTSGAKVAVEGTRVGNLGYFVAPTVLENTTPDMKVIREEIFGSVVCAQPFADDDLDRIAKRANDTIYGLATSVWTRNGGLGHKLASQIRSGTVWINYHNVFNASLLFGGYAQSGWWPADGRGGVPQLHGGESRHSRAVIGLRPWEAASCRLSEVARSARMQRSAQKLTVRAALMAPTRSGFVLATSHRRWRKFSS
jgi:acyl-CoA reductase-like NAD-dependent aldehyde dehydrogenase